MRVVRRLARHRIGHSFCVPENRCGLGRCGSRLGNSSPMFGITTLMVGFVIHCDFFLMRRDTNRTVFAPHSKVAGFDLGLVSFHGFPLSPSPQLVTSEN